MKVLDGVLSAKPLNHQGLIIAGNATDAPSEWITTAHVNLPIDLKILTLG